MTHPALDKAVAACRPLAAAAAQLGAADPIEVLQHIDCDPAAITAYADRLRLSLTDLDKAIEQQKADIAKLEEDSGGEGTDAALGQARGELAELEKDRNDLSLFADRISAVAEQLDHLVTLVSDQITGIADGAGPAAAEVVGGSASAEAEERVVKAVDEIIRLAEQFQRDVQRLRDEFKQLTAEVTDAGVASGAEGGAGASEGGVNRDDGEPVPDDGESAGQQGPSGGSSGAGQSGPDSGSQSGGGPQPGPSGATPD